MCIRDRISDAIEFRLIPTRDCPTDVALAVLGMHIVGRYSSRKATRAPDDDIEFSVFSGSLAQNGSLSA